MALSARGPKLAGCCPASDRRRLASPGIFRPRPDCSGRDPDRPRDMFLAWVPARTLTSLFRPCMSVIVQTKGFERDMHSRDHVRHRPVPVTWPLDRLAADWEQIPARWLALHAPQAPVLPAEPRWPPPLRPARATFAHPPRSIPSRLARNVRDPSGSGSAASMAWGSRVGKRLVGGGKHRIFVIFRPERGMKKQDCPASHFYAPRACAGTRQILCQFFRAARTTGPNAH